MDRTPTHNAHLCSTVCSQARNAHHALGSSHTDCSVIFVSLKRICHLVLHMSHPLLFSYLPFTTSNSPSSFTLPSTTTHEHEAQRVQHEQLREHPVHHAHLQAPQSTSCAIKNHSGVKTCRVAETRARQLQQVNEPKELATVSRIEDYSGDPYQLYYVQENRRTRSPSSDHQRSGIIWRDRDSWLTGFEKSETSYFQSRMHFNDSLENIADSDLEDGELQKMLTSPLYAQKASVKPDAMVV